MAIGERAKKIAAAGRLARAGALSLHALLGLWVVTGVLLVPDERPTRAFALAAALVASWIVFALRIVGWPRRSRLNIWLLPVGWLVLCILVASLIGALANAVS